MNLTEQITSLLGYNPIDEQTNIEPETTFIDKLINAGKDIIGNVTPNVNVGQVTANIDIMPAVITVGIFATLVFVIFKK